MRRLLWVSHFLPYPPSGGVLQRGFGLLSHLAPKFDIHLLAMNQPRLVAQTMKDVERPVEAIVDALSPYCKSIRVMPIPSESSRFGRHRAVALAALGGRSYTEQWLASREMAAAVVTALDDLKPDLAHFDTISLAPYLRLAPSSLATSLGHHNIESHMMRRRARKATATPARQLLHIESGRILALERQFAPRVDVNVVCSDMDAVRLRRSAGARRVHVAENGVLEPEVPAHMLADAATFARVGRRMAFVGRMSAYTNRDAADFLAREIWPAIGARFADASLDFVGSGAPQSAAKLAERDSRVRLHGFVKDVKDVVPPGTVFLCPVRDGGGTKLKILDAMNRGLPIIAHPIAVEGIQVIPGTHVLLARTPEEFVAAAERLLASTELRMSITRAAFELVRSRYAFEEIAAGLARCFEQVIRDHQVAPRAAAATPRPSIVRQGR